MKRHLNTLFVTTQGAYVHKDNENVVVSIDREERLRLPVHTLGSIVCFGNVLCSPFLLGHCAENRVAVAFLTEHGRFLARVEGRRRGTCCCGDANTALPTILKRPSRLFA